jgi:transcriptional regulator with XRE-family HTH domain
MPDPATTVTAQGVRRSRALLRSALGDALRRVRLEQGRTLADVAVAARISMPYLSEVERGLKEVSSEVLAALCAALGIDLSDLLMAVIFQLTGDVPVVSLGVSRTATVGALRPAPAPGRTGSMAPPPARRGDAYALAA